MYLPRNMQKVPQKMIKIQRYLIFQPSEVVIRARKMK